ncbi:Small auxin-up RNA [Sesbania bispinosa]|nr:Small auxin-up RNA [Sesbania bispinosa]
MEVVKGKWRKNVISKAWERWRSSLGGGTGNKWSQLKGTNSENDYYDENEKGRQIAPHGCFSVYVGPQKQRFVVKMEFVNHPLFQTLLDEAELEYGFTSDGPICLPCNVDLFYKVLGEMDLIPCTRRSIAAKALSFLVLHSPARLLCHKHRGRLSAYSVMDSEMLKISRFE